MKYLLTLIILTLVSCSTALEQSSQWHWERLDEYTKFRKSEIQREEYKGYTYLGSESDIYPTLHYLTKMSEITHIDLTFPRVISTPEVTNFWMETLSKIDGIIDVHGNHEYVDFKTSGLQPLRLKIWFKPKAKKEIQQFIKTVENKFTPELKINQT